MDSLHKGQWRGALIFFIYAWTSNWANNRYAAGLRRHRARYDVAVMKISTWYTCFIQTSWQIRVKSSANVCPLSCYTRSVFDIRHCDDYPQLTSTDGGRCPKLRQADYNVVNSFHFIWRSGTRRWHRLQMSCNYMIMSSNGNIFRITDLFWKETTGYRWISLTKANDAELWCFLWSAPEQTIEQTTRRRWFETTSRSLWHHCNDLV